LKLIQQAKADPSGRLDGILSPSQIDTCTADLLRDSHDAAVANDLPFTTHCAQSVNEFNEMTNRHGITPVQWARDIGILGRSTILGHAIFIDEHSWLHWHSHDDLGILAATGTSIAHCPSRSPVTARLWKTSAGTAEPASTSAWAPMSRRII